jgi:protein-tyrosine phosphatase
MKDAVLKEKLKSIIKTANQNVVVIYNKITKELEPIISLSNYIINFAKEKNYIVNSYGTIIKPRKLYASFNNYIQSTSSDIVIEKLFLLKEYIKNKKINFLYQVYDSYVFDFDESEIEEIDSIKNILSQVDNLYFLMSVYSGPTLLKVGIL